MILFFVYQQLETVNMLDLQGVKKSINRQIEDIPIHLMPLQYPHLYYSEQNEEKTSETFDEVFNTDESLEQLEDVVVNEDAIYAWLEVICREGLFTDEKTVRKLPEQFKAAS